MIYKSISELVGKTPLVEIVNYERLHKLKAKILVKLEYLNPAGSVKDRTAKAMIEDAERSGKLKAGGAIIEPTSGNTGIALSALAVPSGYRVILTMPENMSEERIKLMKAYGAEIVLTDGARGMAGAIERAEELSYKLDGVILGQFENPANPEIHVKTTGPEIWEDAGGDIDIFVAGVGTGGTLTGVGKYLKGRNSNIKIFAVEPELSAGKCGHAIQGIGAGFIPKILDTEIYDGVIAVKDGDAFETGREIARAEGYLVGISSGAVLRACTTLALKHENAGKTIVAVLPDSGDRYLSVLYAD